MSSSNEKVAALFDDLCGFLEDDLGSFQLTDAANRRKTRILEKTRALQKEHSEFLVEVLDDIKNPSAAELKGKCFKDGFLGRKKGFVMKNLWCVLGHDKVFYFYNKDTDANPMGSFNVQDYTVKWSEDRKKKLILDFTPNVTNKKSYQFVGPEAKRWSRVISVEVNQTTATPVIANNSTDYVDVGPLKFNLDTSQLTSAEQKKAAPLPPKTPAPDDLDFYDDNMVTQPQDMRASVIEDVLMGDYDTITIASPSGAVKPPQADDDLEIYDDVLVKPGDEASTIMQVNDLYIGKQPHGVMPPRTLLNEPPDGVPSRTRPPPKKVNGGKGTTTTKSSLPTHEYCSLYYAIHSLTSGVKDDELSFKYGDVIKVISREFDAVSWWVGRLNGKVGLVPKNFLQPVYVPVEG